jgi:hypothetical protein
MSDPAVDPKASAPFYKKWWFITIAVIFGLVIASSVLGGGDDSDTSSTQEDPSTSSESSSGAESESALEEDAAEEPEAPSNFYEDEYGVFAPLEESGTGDAVVRLPEGALYAIVTATHNGSSNFSIQSLDAANGLSELLVNEIGSYSGVTALGFSSFGDSADKLQITANGEWTLLIAPVSSAPGLPSSGSGDGVFIYDGSAPIWQITHSGSSNFAVVQESPSSLFGLLVNEIGTYDGSVTGVAGPSVVIISADGDWTFTAQ